MFTVLCSVRNIHCCSAKCRLRCIRLPESQSATNIFLKTSVRVFVSQHLHETNRINSFIINHYGISFKEIFNIFWLFWSFFVSCIRTLFLDIHQEKLSCNADIEMPYCIQFPLMTKPSKFC